MDFEGAIKRPFSDLKKLLLGIVLMIVPIVNFLSYGYIFESAKLSLKGKKELPEWKDWGKLFVKGLLWFVINLIYAIPLLIIVLIVAISVGFSFLSNFIITESTEYTFPVEAMVGSLVPWIIIGGLLALLIYYILPSAILTYAKENKFGSAFRLGIVFRKAFTGEYFVSWLVGMIVYIIIVFILNFIPFVGAPIGAFIGIMFMITLVSEAYAKIK